MKLDELTLADGHVDGIRSSLSEVIIDFTDWEERRWEIVFENVIGLEAFGIEGEELDRVEEREDKALMERSRKIAQEPDTPMRCYSFYSPWRDDCLLTIVASSCVVRRAKSEGAEPH